MEVTEKVMHIVCYTLGIIAYALAIWHHTH